MHLVSTTAIALLLLGSGVHANLDQLAKAAGKLYFGSATDNNELSDSAYVAILKNSNEFGQITPGNTQKWQYTEPQNSVFSYPQGDVITSFAQGNRQILRCHTQTNSRLVSSGSWTAAQLTDILNAHIASEVGHYKGQCYAWDVVNEALNDDGTFRTDVFYNVLGTSYIPIAFKAAAAADPAAKLYYNDYNIEYSGAKATAAQGIVKLVQSYAGARIDGVGFQGHFIVGGTPSRSDLASVLNSFVNLGVEVAYTEVDVRFSSLPATSAGYAQQATDYASVVGACLDVAKCIGLTVWDFDDKYSWIPSTFSGQGEACLYWQNLTAKPAYYKVQSLLAAAATSTASPSSTTSRASSTSTTLITTTKASSTSPSISTKTTSSTPISTSTAVHWGQCGGNGWTGPTVCASPYTCQVQNAWYSQCL
ncbi:endo-1,4-beta-xylanase Z [Coniochaeta sp. 2T2.1]|nr:endo-1,4-beta-xylanase Z [Coniochaeta sp. 2T2.1]